MADHADSDVVMVGASEQINLIKFCSLLQEHDQGSVKCQGGDCVMLFGSTGVGKSTLLHLLAGAVFSREAVEIATADDDDEFGGDIELQLITKMQNPGCDIGNSATSTTMLLNSHFDLATRLTYIDTPGFNNVGGEEDITIDAANSAAIMSTIRSCGSLRIVFLISVKDELNTTKAGQIKKLFEVMDKFIKDASTRMSSVLMLFTHTDGYTSAAQVIPLLNRIGKAKVLPDNLMVMPPCPVFGQLLHCCFYCPALMLRNSTVADTNTPTQPFLRHAIMLLKTHGDDLLVRPAEEDAQTRMNVVRDLLQSNVSPISDTSAVLQCPLSEEVLSSLGLACALEKEAIVRGLNDNRRMTDARVHLEHLRLLCDALNLPNLNQSYKSALDEMVSHAGRRSSMAFEALQKQSFSQVRSFLSIFNCDLCILAPHMEIIGPGDVLDTLKSECLRTINSTCDHYITQLDQALVEDDFCAAVTVLSNCEEMLEHLKEFVSLKRQDMISLGAIERVRARTLNSQDKASSMINDKRFDAELGAFLDAIRNSSENEALLRHVQKHLEGEHPAGEADYEEIFAKLNTSLIGIGDELKARFNDAQRAFVEEARSTADALAQIDAAEDHLGSLHLGQQAKDARTACREAFTALKDKIFEQLRNAIETSDWEEASLLFEYMKSAGKLGSEEERRSVEVRLDDMQISASTHISNVVDSLSSFLERNDFQGFMQLESSLGNAKRLPKDSVLRQASLDRFQIEHDRFLSQVNENFTQSTLQCKEALEKHNYAEMATLITHIERMADASVGQESASGCAVPDFSSRVAGLLQHVDIFGKREVDECKQLVAQLNDNLPSESDVANLNMRLQQVKEYTKQIGYAITGKIPSLCSIMRLIPSDLFPASDSSQRRGDTTPRGSQSKGRRQRNREANASADTWDVILLKVLEAAQDELTKSLLAYANACRERCLSSLAEEPKPLCNDIVGFLNTLKLCQLLDPFFATAAGTQKNFAEQRKAVSAAVKNKFIEVRDECGRDVRADKMADAQAKLGKAKEMLILRDEFAGDAITLDAAVDEMCGNFNQKSGAFARSVDDALAQERFPELDKLLGGYRNLTGAAEQEEYNNALSSLKEAGDGKYKVAMQIISSINDDARGRSQFPPSVEQMASALRWIESARCLGEGEDPILPHEVYATWQSAFDAMNSKLELLQARESKLDEWKFTTVEEMHRRLGELLMLRFPVDISKTITRMKIGLSEALEAKVRGLDEDVKRALKEGDYLTIDLIFQEVKNAKDADSYFVNNKMYISLIISLENFLNDLVDSIKSHFMKLEIKEAHIQQEHLWKLEKASVARNQVARAGLDALAEQKKKSMINRLWITTDHVRNVKLKVNGFRDVDPVRYQSLVSEFMESFDANIKRLRKVETKADVIEVGQVVLEIPRFATILDSEQPAFKKGWEEIWNSFFESVDKKLRLACATAGHEHDISDSISFLRAARKLLQQNVTPAASKARVNPCKTKPAQTLANVEVVDPELGQESAGINVSASACSDKPVKGPTLSQIPSNFFSSLLYKGFSGSQPMRQVDSHDATSALDDDTHISGDVGEDEFLDAEEDFIAAAIATEEELECVFPFPREDLQVKELIEKLDSLLGHIEVDVAQIDCDWTQYVEQFDCKTEALSFGKTLHFIRQLKRQSQAIRSCGEYGWGGAKAVPTTDRALSKISTTAADQVKALDASKPEKCVVVLHSLIRFVQECYHVIDDDAELQHALTDNMIKFRDAADDFIKRIENDFVEKSTNHYAEAQKQHDPQKRKSALCEVIKNMELHQRLDEKLVARGVRGDHDGDTPLVADIKTQITQMEKSARERLVGGARKCTAEQIAESIHGIYMTAMDLGNTSILNHSESCIGKILHECVTFKKNNQFGLQEVGIVLERDLPQGSEIVASMPQFAELNLLAFQKMTTGKTAEGTIEDVAKLNNLSKRSADNLLRVVQEVLIQYDSILRASRFYVDLPSRVQKIMRHYEDYHSMPALIGGVFAVWSLASMTETCPTPRRPLPAQVVAIIRLLALDKTAPAGFFDCVGRWFKSESQIDASHLAQIKTGQGKSVVLGCLATVLSIVGFSVDVVCYSQYLSDRDHNDFEAVFKLFNVNHMVKYGTFQQLSERLINAEGDVRDMTRDVILSSNGAPRVIQGAKTANKPMTREKRILLVDEVDVFFSRSFYGETYDPVEPLKLAAIADLQKKAWTMKAGDTKLILPALKSMQAYSTLMRDHAGVKNILEGQISKMLRDLDAWKGGDSDEPFRAYKIIDGKVAYKNGVCYDSKISYGYVTLWTYFHEVECKRVPEATLHDYLGLMIKCGQFSYAEIPKCYNLILGVTGTLVPETNGGPHPLGTFEQVIIRDDYKITGQTELPSVFGEKNLTFRENEHVSVEKTEDNFNNAIGKEVAKALEGRAVLVFFESEASMEAWQDSPYGRRVPAGSMECIKSDTRNITMKVRKATHSGQATLLSREHGRGLDFHCSDKTVDELGGLHVVQTFLSEELSEEIQIRGRTARQKNKGSFQMVLLAKDLERFEISTTEIEQKEKGIFVPVISVGPECAICHDKLKEPKILSCGHGFCGGCIANLQARDKDCKCPLCRAPVSGTPSAAGSKQTMYEFLHAKRAAYLEKSSVTRREAVWCAKALHEQSTGFQRDLLALARTPALGSLGGAHLKDRCLKFLVGRNMVQAKCRLLCLSDATGSMGRVWGQTQDSIRTMLERITVISGSSGNIEVKWLAFRDYELDKSMVLEASPWTDDPASLVKFVGGIKCLSGAGCDGREAVEAALNYVNNDPGLPTRVLLIGDAPPHDEGKGKKLERLTVHASNLERGAFVEGGVLSTDYWEECAKLKQKEVKVFPFYLHECAKHSFDEIAKITGGESEKLDSSDPESLVHAVCETALEDIGGASMQEKYRAQYRT